MEKMKNNTIDLELHFRNVLTVTNLVSSLQYWLPELKNAIQEYKEDDPEIELPFLFIGEIFNPLLRSYLDNAQQNPNLVKRLFHFLELMARSTDKELWNIQAIGILNKLNSKQLEVAKKLMGPSTKRNFSDYQNYVTQLLKK